MVIKDKLKTKYILAFLLSTMNDGKPRVIGTRNDAMKNTVQSKC